MKGKFEAEFKLSQKHDQINKLNVIGELEKMGDEEKSLAVMMKRLRLNA